MKCSDCGWIVDDAHQDVPALQCPDCGSRVFEQGGNDMTMDKQETKQTGGPITRDMNIQQLANTYPEAVGVMAEKGLHCFGCHASAYDTVEAGARGHGMPDDDIDRMVDEMNAAVAQHQAQKTQPKESQNELVVTEHAAKKLFDFMKTEKKEGYGLRVAVVPGGCSGFSYALDFDKASKEGDIVLDRHGVKVFLDKESMQMMSGATIDYVDGLQGSGFKIENPNAHSNCGCGKSFS
ncbi:iron-sulfur cluster assembly accessory protein [Candidatus Woesearchaeota archaeon]|nr:iron-sulfur cluster assembly accessory protein [Candidatus Woesearchaeota archaeon]